MGERKCRGERIRARMALPRQRNSLQLLPHHQCRRRERSFHCRFSPPSSSDPHLSYLYWRKYLCYIKMWFRSVVHFCDLTFLSVQSMTSSPFHNVELNRGCPTIHIHKQYSTLTPACQYEEVVACV